MGRGRQKAKQTKVARELKYFSPDTNYRALEQELTSGGRRSDLVTESLGSSETAGETEDYVDRGLDDR